MTHNDTKYCHPRVRLFQPLKNHRSLALNAIILLAGFLTLAAALPQTISAPPPPLPPLPAPSTISLIIINNQLQQPTSAENAPTPETNTAETAHSQPQDAVSRLRRLAEQESPSPVDHEIPLPPGLSKNLFAPVPTPADEKSSLSLWQTLQQIHTNFRNQHPGDSQPRTETPPDEDALAQAELLFLKARGEYLDGDYFSSIQTAEKALRYDPHAVSVLHLLAEDYLKTTGRAQALIYYKQILNSDPEDEESLMRVGNAAIDRGQNLQAAEYFSRLLYHDTANQTPDNTNPDENHQTPSPNAQSQPHLLRILDNHGLRYIAASALGDALSALEYRKAAAQAWQIAVTIPEELPRARIFNREITGLQLRRGTLLRHLGDAFVQLHQYDDALNAYRQAQTLPLTDPTSILPRQIYIFRMQGRPYAAMEAVLRTLQSPRMSSAQPQQLRKLLAYLRPLPESKALADAVAQLADSNPDFLPITLAAAAVEPDKQGIRRVQLYLADHAEDKHAWNALLPWAEQTGGTERVLKLVLSQKNYIRLFTDEAARKILIVAGRRTETAKAWESLSSEWRNNTESKLLYSQIRSLLGWGERADTIVSLLHQKHQNDIDILLTQASTFIRGGEFTKARNILFGIKSNPKLLSALLSPARRTYRAATLFNKIEDDNFAVTLMDDLARKATLVSHEPGAFIPDNNNTDNNIANINTTTIVSDFDPVDFRIRKAELLLSLQRGDEAENLLKEALQSDPKREKTYLLLLRLYGAPGQAGRPDDYRNIVGELVRELPDSKAVRLLRASQNAAMGQTKRAITELTNLLREDFDNREILDLLVSNWTKADKFADAIRWLEQQLTSRPGDYALRNALVEIKIKAGLFDEAVAMLKSTLKDNPYDESTASELATILHRNGKEDEARIVRRDRLQHRPPSVERSVLLANLAIDDTRIKAVPALLHQAADQARGDMPYHTDQLIALARKYRDAAPDDTDTANQFILTVLTAADRELTQQSDRVPKKISLYAYRAWCSAVTQLNQPVDQFTIIVKKLRADYPDSASTVIQLTKDDLEKAGRIDAACAFVDDYLRNLPDKGWSRFDVTLVDWRVIKATERKEPDLAIILAKRFDTSGKLAELIPAGTKDSPLTNYLYQRIASGFLLNNDNDSYEKILRAIIKIQPDHAGANNDLGYSLIDRDVQFDHAEKMIIKAYQSDPANNAYIDSIGWLRYKQGRFTDQGTEPLQWGAVTLLKQAVDSQVGRDDPVILNHYADALWRAGKHDEAVKIWQQVISTYDRLIEQLKQADQSQVSNLQSAYLPVKNDAEAKLKAIENGNEPATAPLANGN